MAQPKSADPAVVMRLEGVSRTFQMGELEVRALVNFTLDILASELLVLAGPSGSGKTTALNIIGGLDQCTAGRVVFRGQDLTHATTRQLTRYRRESVGFVFQFYNLVPDLTALENVMVATELCQQPLDERHALELVELDQRLDHFPSQLSGGEQQRVAIARALAKNPDLLLCDEPTGALDFETGKRALRLLSDVARKMGKTVIIITHNTAIAEMADRVVHLRSGEIVSIDVNSSPKPAEEIIW
ncbi:MAG: ABC transporter ATP-binding protein [Pirellulales bacterium]|nr:ABC transporter ATP-binding protein [Pirellulales bacterium]